MQKKGSDSESFDEDDDFENSFEASPPKREVTSRRAAATKVLIVTQFEVHPFKISINSNTYFLSAPLSFL